MTQVCAELIHEQERIWGYLYKKKRIDMHEVTESVQFQNFSSVTKQVSDKIHPFLEF